MSVLRLESEAGLYRCPECSALYGNEHAARIHFGRSHAGKPFPWPSKRGGRLARKPPASVARSTQASAPAGGGYPDTPKRRRGPRYEQELAEQCIAAGLPAFIMEFRFDAVRDWRIDLAWPGQLAVEIDGAVHRIKAQFAGDLEKHQALFFAGWPLLRVSTAQVRDGSAVALIARALVMTAVPWIPGREAARP